MRLQFESYYGACPSLSGSRLRTSHACNIRMEGEGRRRFFFFKRIMNEKASSFISLLLPGILRISDCEQALMRSVHPFIVKMGVKENDPTDKAKSNLIKAKQINPTVLPK